MQSTGSTLIVGFLGKKQYAAKAPSKLIRKLSKHLCLECSTLALFLSSSFTLSMLLLVTWRFPHNLPRLSTRMTLKVNTEVGEPW